MEEPVRQLIRRFVLAPLALGAVVLTAASAAPPVHAQILYGSIVGNVTDAQGAGIPAATVTITSKDTNLTRETITNAVGTYNIPNVVAGTYDVKVSLSGFREAVRAGVPVNVGQTSRVDVKLEIGTMSETVTVQSETQLL